jgi:hypothetical protein
MTGRPAAALSLLGDRRLAGSALPLGRAVRRVAGLVEWCWGVLIAAPAAHARDAIVNSFDGTPIVRHFFPAPRGSRRESAPRR